MKKRMIIATHIAFIALGLWLIFFWMLGDRAAAVETRNIPYGDLPRQTLDLYVPRNGDIPHSTIIFFYGGRWKAGNKDMYAFVGRTLAARGYAVVIPDYRLYPDVRFPEFLNDAARAVAWTRTQSASYGGNADSLVLMGHSAGAYIPMMLALDPSYLSDQRISTRDIHRVIGLAGPYDFLPFGGSDLEEIFGGVDARRTQPISFVRPDAPPLLLLHGFLDPIVWVRNSRSLFEKQEKAGGTVVLKEYPLEHFLLVGAFLRPFHRIFPVVGDIDAFIKKSL